MKGRSRGKEQEAKEESQRKDEEVKEKFDKGLERKYIM